MVKIEFEEGSEYKWAVNLIIAITKPTAEPEPRSATKPTAKSKTKQEK